MFPRKQIKANARAALSANYWPIVGYPFLLGMLLGAIFSVFYVAFIIIMVASIGFSAFFEGGEPEITSMVGPLIFYTIGIIIFCAFAYVIAAGELLFYYRAYRGQRPEFSTFFEGFRNRKLFHVMGGMMLVFIKLILWVIPGEILLTAGLIMMEFDTLWAILAVVGGILYLAGFVMIIVKGYQYRMIPYLLVDRPEFKVKECFKASKHMTDGNKLEMFVLDLSFIGWVILTMFTCGILGIFYVNPYMRLAQAGVYDYLSLTRLNGQNPAAPVNNGFNQGFNQNPAQDFNGGVNPEFTNGPVFQSATYEGEVQAPEQPVAQPQQFNQPVAPTEPQQNPVSEGSIQVTDNDDIFDE